MPHPSLHLTVNGSTLSLAQVPKEVLEDQLRQFFMADPFRLTGIFNMQMQFDEHTPRTPELDQFAQTVTEVFQSTVAQILKRVQPNEEDAFWGFLNTLDNMPGYASWPDIRDIENIYKGHVGVVISTGPSLKFILPELKKHRENVILFACDSSVKGLLKEGITPDFVATTERLGDCYHLFKDLPALPHTALLGFDVVPKKGFAAWQGPKLKIDWDAGFLDWFATTGKKVHVANCPSVSHLCYLGLRILGCDRIVLAGQDLCFDPQSGKSHTENVDEFLLQVGDDQIEINGSKTPLYNVTGYDGLPKLTTSVWHGFAKSFSALIKRYGGEVFHALPEGHGIPIPGATRAEPHQVLSKLCSQKPDRTKHHFVFTEAPPLPPDLSVLKQTHLALTDFSQTALACLRQISIAWRDHDTRVKGRNHETYFRVFFAELDAILEDIQEHHDGFFQKKFLRLIMNSYLGLMIEKKQQEATNPDFIPRTLELIQIYFKIFNLIHLWASRSLEAIAAGVAATPA